MTKEGNSSDLTGAHDVPGFDEDSPDLKDPMIDPTEPAKPPVGEVDKSNKRGEGDKYPPYDGEPE